MEDETKGEGHKMFKVHVYNYHRGERIARRNRPLAYLRYITPGGCLHEVGAEGGAEAKRSAIAEHLAGCDQADRYCDECRRLRKSCLASREEN